MSRFRRHWAFIPAILCVCNVIAEDGVSSFVSGDAAYVAGEQAAPWPYVANAQEHVSWATDCDSSCDAAPVGDGGCDSGGCSDAKRCRPYYFGFEYLNWWSSARSLPPLVAAGDGLPPNATLFGGHEVGDEYQSGFRVTAGWWRDDCESAGFLLRGYGNEGSDSEFDLSSNGTPSFAIPFINDGSTPVLQGQPDSLELASPGLLQPGRPASVSARAAADLIGGDLLYRKLYQKGCGYRIDLLAGYQYAAIDDEVALTTSTSRIGGPEFGTFDSFDAENRFHGGSIGFMIERGQGPFRLQLLSKLGLGNMNQQISIRGQNSVNGAVTGGGIFAQDQSASGGPGFNIGDYEQDEFAVSPEVSVKGIWNVRDKVNLTVGYTFIYWSDVVRASESIDTRINRDVFFDGPFIPGGGSNPSFAFDSTDLWAHTLDLGLLVQY